MELNLETTYADRAYPILSSLVTPRPIAWVTTLGEDGKVNAAPFSFFNLLGSSPPILGFTPGDREDGTPKDTARNIRLNHEFVVNLVDEPVAQLMNSTAASLPFGVSEPEVFNIETAASTSIRVPRIAQAPVSLECVEWGTLQIGDNRVVIGLIKRIHLRDELFDVENARVRGELFNPIGRMASPDWYCQSTDRFQMKRPQ